MFTKKFWRDTTERAISTAGEGMLLVVGADGFNVLTADWQNLLGGAAGGALLAVLKALIASRIGSSESASLDPKA